MHPLRLMDEQPRAIGALDLAVRREVEIDLGMAERPAPAIASGDHAVDIDRLERLHLSCFRPGQVSRDWARPSVACRRPSAKAPWVKALGRRTRLSLSAPGVIDRRTGRMIPIEAAQSMSSFSADSRSATSRPAPPAAAAGFASLRAGP